MNDWTKGRMLAYDCESTGIDVTQDRIITAYAALVSGGEDIIERHWTINPGVHIPEAATAVHGITDAHVAEHGQDPAAAIADIAGFVTIAMASGIPVVGWNVGPYDLSLLDHECRRHGLASLEQRLGGAVRPVIDGIVLDKHCDPWRRKTVASRRLIDCAKHYGVELSEADAHGARADAIAATRTIWQLARRFPQLADLDLVELHDSQVEWHAEQAASFETYLRKSKPDAVVDRGWPLRLVTA